MHPLPHMDLPFPPYDPWPTPTPVTGDLQSYGDGDTAGDAPSGLF